MTHLPAPKPRPKFKITKKAAQFRMEFPKERTLLNRIKTLAERGIVSIDFQSPPMLDQRGNVRIYMEYSIKEIMTEEAVAEARKRELSELQEQLRSETYTGAPQSGPRPVSPVGLTKDELDLLRPSEDEEGP